MLNERGLASAVFVMVLVIAPSSGWASPGDQRPFWTEQAVFHFGDDVFFTGRASCSPNVEAGRQRAFLAAVQEIKNFARSEEVGGFLLETQMVFEEPQPKDCPNGTTTVWRLLRVPKSSLSSLNRRWSQPNEPHYDQQGMHVTSVRNLTPRIGMPKEEIWNRFGQPRSVWITPSNGDVTLEYPQFGLSLVLDRDDVLKSWKLAGPHFRSTGTTPESSGQPTKTVSALEQPAIDLTDRLRELEEEGDAEARRGARAYCAVRFPDEVKGFFDARRVCEQREYERLRGGSRGSR